MKKPAITPGVIVERVGDDLMVIVPGNRDVISLSGRPAHVLLAVQAGRDVHASEPALTTLSDLGIVTSPGISRRGLIQAGAIGAGTGIAVMAMPGVAAASSGVLAPSSGVIIPLVRARFVQGFVPENVSSTLGGAEDDLYFVIILDYAAAGIEEPAAGLTGTVTSDRFVGSRQAVFFPYPKQSEWIALVSDAKGLPLPGTFEFRYEGFIATGLSEGG